MREVGLPPADRPPLQRSVAACIAAILELDVTDVPAPAADHPEPWTVWRNWLAQRGFGLVPVARPSTFAWAGPWLAIVGCDDGQERAAVAFGAPPGIAWAPLPGTGRFEDVVSGFVIAAADPVQGRGTAAAAERREGRVETIAVAPSAEAPMRAVERAVARAGRGLEGDRYFRGGGTFSNPHARGIDLTLIEAETTDALGGLERVEFRRNIVTRGVDLNALVGRRFAIGEVECLGRRLCEPCAHLERLTEPGTLRALVHRGGLRADILCDGIIGVGDAITLAEADSPA